MDTLEELIEKQFRWPEHFPTATVREMMMLHRLIEIALEAPEYVERR